MDSLFLTEEFVERMVVSKPDGHGSMAFVDDRGRIREFTFMAIKIQDPPSVSVMDFAAVDSIVDLTPYALQLFLNDIIQKLKNREPCAEVLGIVAHLLTLFVIDSEKLDSFCRKIHETAKKYQDNPVKNSVALKNIADRIGDMEEKSKLFIVFLEKIKISDFTPIEGNGETVSKSGGIKS